MSVAALAAAISNGDKTRLSLSLARSDLMQLPAPEKMMKDGLVEKRVVNSAGLWHQRRLVLTEEALYVAREDSMDVLDQIHLASILNVSLTTQSQSFFRHEGQNSPVGRKKEFNRHAPPSPDDSEHSPPHHLETGENYFDITTRKDNRQQNRTYHFRVETAEGADEWRRAVSKASKTAQQLANERRNTLCRIRMSVRGVYESHVAQGTIVAIIIANFGAAVASAQLVPQPGSVLEARFFALEAVFTILFTIELAVNMFSRWFKPFWRDKWNIFDLVIVVVSVASILLDDVPGFTTMRLLRVLRVARVLELLSSLRKIIHALTAAIFPVLNAFLVLLLVTCIYAIIGVEMWRARSPEFFGNFSAALFTMFQVCTGDGWADTLARPMFTQRHSLTPDAGVALFFLSYILIVGSFLLNVVIAVLLDEFISAVEAEKRLKRIAVEEATVAGRHDETPLDPLLATLTCFNSPTDLTEKIRSIYKVLDADDSGGLSFEEMRVGMLNLEPPISLCAEDFENLQEAVGAGGEHGRAELTVDDFERTIRSHLNIYVQRLVAQRMAHAQGQDADLAAVLAALKMVMTATIQCGGAGTATPVPMCQRMVTPSQPQEAAHAAGAEWSPAQAPQSGGEDGRAGGSANSIEHRELAALHSKLDTLLARTALAPSESSPSSPPSLSTVTASARTRGSRSDSDTWMGEAGKAEEREQPPRPGKGCQWASGSWKGRLGARRTGLLVLRTLKGRTGSVREPARPGNLKSVTWQPEPALFQLDREEPELGLGRRQSTGSCGGTRLQCHGNGQCSRHSLGGCQTGDSRRGGVAAPGSRMRGRDDDSEVHASPRMLQLPQARNGPDHDGHNGVNCHSSSSCCSLSTPTTACALAPSAAPISPAVDARTLLVGPPALACPQTPDCDRVDVAEPEVPPRARALVAPSPPAGSQSGAAVEKPWASSGTHACAKQLTGVESLPVATGRFGQVWHAAQLTGSFEFVVRDSVRRASPLLLSRSGSEQQKPECRES